MDHAGRLGPVPGLLAVLAAATLAAAGCVNARPAAPARTQGGSVRTWPASTGLPAASAPGSRHFAEHVSHWLFRHLTLPPGARPIGSRAAPAPLRYPPAGTIASGHLLKRHAIFTLPRPAGRTLRYLQAHVPSGLIQTGSALPNLSPRDHQQGGDRRTRSVTEQAARGPRRALRLPIDQC